MSDTKRAIHAGEDAAEIFAAFASALQFEDLPADIVAQAKLTVIDTVGVALAGAVLGEGGREVAAYASAQGGVPVARVWSNGNQTTAVLAALVNGALARVLDFDDILDYPQVHIAACVVPAAIAAAEAQRQPVSGKKLIIALAAGAELQARLAAAIVPSVDLRSFPKLQPTQIFGYFSAALTSGLLLDFSPDKLLDALGLALMQAAGTQELVVHSPISVGKGIYSGFSAQGGVQAAMMAHYGVVARGRIWEGAAGMFAAHYNGRYDRDALVAELGAQYYSGRRCFKMQPGTLASHAFVEAALEAKHELDVAVAEIASVALVVGPWGQAMCEPVQMRRRPQTSSAAMNNIPFCVAKALVNGRIEIEDFEAEGRGQAETLAMVDRVAYELDPSLGEMRALEPGTVILTAADGRICRKRVDYPRGHYLRPVDSTTLIEKFHRNLASAGNPPINADEFTARVRAMEHEQDVRDLIERMWMGSDNVR
jgi:2-methylcitrate dehydratase PrpD